MNRVEMAHKINDNHSDLLFNLYERWQDEKEYEDFNDYVAVVKKVIPETVKGTKRPFGFMFQCENGLLHVSLKRQGNYLKIQFKSA